MSSVYRLLGLARRAGAVAPGSHAARQAVRAGAARLVLLAEDASPDQLDKVRRTSSRRAVPLANIGDRAALGAAVGLAPISALAVTNPRFAERVLEELAASSVPQSHGPKGSRAPQGRMR